MALFPASSRNDKKTDILYSGAVVAPGNNVPLAENAEDYDFLIVQTSNSNGNSRGVVIMPSALYSNTSIYDDFDGTIQASASGKVLYTYPGVTRYVRMVYGMRC